MILLDRNLLTRMTQSHEPQASVAGDRLDVGAAERRELDQGRSLNRS